MAGGQLDVAQAAAKMADLQALRSELLNAREAEQRQLAAQQRQVEQERELVRTREKEQAERERAQAMRQAELAQQAQQQAAAVQQQQAQQAAWQEGLSTAGGALVARMKQLQEDVALRCEEVERSARDDVRRNSLASSTGLPSNAPTPPPTPSSPASANT